MARHLTLRTALALISALLVFGLLVAVHGRLVDVEGARDGAASLGRRQNIAQNDENKTCEAPGGRLCSEPWYDATEHPETLKPGWEAAHIAHGIFMAAPFSLFFPLGALAPHVGLLASSRPAFHQNCMLIGQGMLLVGFGFGVWLSFLSEKMWNSTHQILGTIIFALVPIELYLGYRHHREPAQSRTWLWFAHTWYGRAVIILGIANAALGLQLAGHWIMSGFIAFIVCTLIFAGSYFLSQVWVAIQEARMHRSWKAIFFPGRPLRAGADAWTSSWTAAWSQEAGKSDGSRVEMGERKVKP